MWCRWAPPAGRSEVVRCHCCASSSQRSGRGQTGSDSRDRSQHFLSDRSEDSGFRTVRFHGYGTAVDQMAPVMSGSACQQTSGSEHEPFSDQSERSWLWIPANQIHREQEQKDSKNKILNQCMIKKGTNKTKKIQNMGEKLWNKIKKTCTKYEKRKTKLHNQISW